MKIDFQISDELQQAAQRLLDNADFLSMIGARSRMLMNETMAYNQKDEILAAHSEFKAIEEFYTFVQFAAGGNE